MDAVSLLKTLNRLGGENGIGLADIIENRLVGMKSRGVYETPDGTILYHTHEQLYFICPDKGTQHFKQKAALTFADLVYNGQWFTPLQEALSVFVSKTQQTVTGDVKLKLYKENIINAGIRPPYTLYSETFASFGQDDVYHHDDAEALSIYMVFLLR